MNLERAVEPRMDTDEHGFIPISEVRGVRPPWAWLDAPSRPAFLPTDDLQTTHNFPPPVFSARARKTAPEAGALPLLFRSSG